MKRDTPKAERIRPAGPDHQVVTVTVESGGRGRYCKRPCADCPWRRDAVGVFPAEAFRHSAEVAYDLSQHTFACHTAGTADSRICAGFLLRGADHNLTVRIGRMRGEILQDVNDGGHVLFENYREMAIGNGVSPDDPVLAPCR